MTKPIQPLAACRTFAEVLSHQAAHCPERVFIHDLRTKREYSFVSFDRIVTQTAHFFASRGVHAGDRITAVIENSPEFCFCYFAALRLGAIFNPMPFASHADEVERNIRFADSRLVLIDRRKQGEFPVWRDHFVAIAVGAEREFEGSVAGYAQEASAFIAVDPTTPACLYYSSGTTDDPKGVLFSHANMIADISSICRGFGFSKEHEVHLIVLPLGHTASTNYSFLPCMYVAGSIVMAENFWHIRQRIWKVIEEFRVTYIEVVPTVLYSILNMHHDCRGADISSLRYFGCGSAPLQKAIQSEIEKRFGKRVANLYGLSETGPSHIDDPLQADWQPGSIGLPLDVNQVRIVDDLGTECSHGDVGEIVIKGDNVFVGYFKNDKQYRSVVRNGWFHTGDLGYRDNRGVFYFVDRKKDLIIKGGVNIVPGEIDEILLQHEAVKEAVTIGIADEMFGEDIKSFVVLKDGFNVSADELLRHCAQHLARHKVPKQLVLTQDIPKTHSGKLLRKTLRAREQGKT